MLAAATILSSVPSSAVTAYAEESAYSVEVTDVTDEEAVALENEGDEVSATPAAETIVETGTPVEGGTEEGTPVEGDTESGTPVEGGTEEGTPVEGGTESGTPVEGGTESGTPVEGGTESGTPIEGGSESGTPVEGGTESGMPIEGGTEEGTPAEGSTEGTTEETPTEGTTEATTEETPAEGSTEEIAAEAATEDALADKELDEEIAVEETARADRLTKITFKSGVTKGVISQEAGTLKWYEYTRTPSTSKDTIRWVIDGTRDISYGSDYSWRVNAVTLTTGNQVASLCGTLIAYNETAAREDGITYGADEIPADEYVLAKVQLTTTTPTWIKNAPTVKLVSATDIALRVALTPPKGYSGSSGYYEVTAQSIDHPDAEPIVDYFYQYDTSATEYNLIVKDVALGQGSKENYSVTARLIKTTDDKEPVDDGSNVAFASKTSTAVKMATKTPYYATSISLKGVNTTIYSGCGEGQRLAKVNFGSDTTYTDVQSVEITDVNGNDTLLDAYYNDGYIIFGSQPVNSLGDEEEYDIDGYVAPGKYILTVTADAPEDAIAATASLNLTVVSGIVSFEPYSATPTIYKAANKAASATISIQYTGYNATYAPKTKRFYYEVIGGGLGAYSDAKGNWHDYVTVKNGKVTIDKNYQLQEDEAEFTVRVYANDYAWNDTYSDITFTVTAEASQLGGIVLVDNENRPVSIPKAGISVRDLGSYDNNYWLAAIVKGAQVGPDGAYASDDIVADCTITTNNKSVTVEEDGTINVTDPLNKNVTFTAKSSDGTKTVRTTFKITYAEPEGTVGAYLLPLKDHTLEQGWNNPIALTSGETIDVKDILTGNNLFITLKDDNGYLDRTYNYTIQTSGLSVIANPFTRETDTAFAQNQSLQAIMTGAKATITVRNGSKTVARYNLVNSAYQSLATVRLTPLKGQKLYLEHAQYGNSQAWGYTATNVPENAEHLVLDPANAASAAIMDGFELTYYEAVKNWSGFVKADGIYKTGTARFYAVFYDKDYNPVSKPVTVSISVTARANNKFTLTTSYTMANTQDQQTWLQFKCTNVREVQYTTLYSANIKGQSNHFIDYFDLSQGGTLTLKQPIDNMTKATSMVGYVKYKVTYWSGATETKTVKITVKLTVPKK